MHDSPNIDTVKIPVEPLHILKNDLFHFLNNLCIVKVLKPIIDSIGRLERESTNLGDIWKEILFSYTSIIQYPYQDGLMSNLQMHALAVIDLRAQEFDEDIYLVAFFLVPRF
jgi:hypothetical protein